MSFLFHNLQLIENYPDVQLIASVYQDNGNTALVALEPTTGETIATLTVNVDMLPTNIVHIKNYSENEGVLDWLVENSIIKLMPIYDTSTGFVEVQGAKLVHEGLLAQAEDARQALRNSMSQ